MALMADMKFHDAQNSHLRYPTSFIVVNTMERIKQIRTSMCVCGYVCVCVCVQIKRVLWLKFFSTFYHTLFYVF